MPKEKSKTELPIPTEGDLQARLIKLREAAGFDMPQMAAGLCLSQDVIANLENENFDLLPEPPYVRGYLRTYAKLGDSDPSELINCYETLRGADADELNFQIKPADTITTSPQKTMSPVLGQVIALGVFIGFLGLIYMIPAVNQWVSKTWQSFSSPTDPTVAENNPSLLGQLPVPSPLPDIVENDSTTEANNSSTSDPQTDSPQGNLPAQENTTEDQSSAITENSDNTNNLSNGGSESTNNSSETSEENSNTTESSTDTTNTTESVADTNQETPVSPDEIVSSDPTGLINIKLVFNNEVWLRIKDKDNKTVFESLNQAGTEKTVDLQKPLTFRVGNAQGLSLFIDNQPADISTYINGSVANFTLE